MTTLNLKYSLQWQDRSFINSLPKTFKQISKPEHKLIKENFVEIFNTETEYIQDRQSQSFLLMCSYIAAYYDFLTIQNVSKDCIMNQLADSLAKSAGGKYVTFFTKVMVRIKKDKRQFIENSTLQSKKSFGKFINMTEEKNEYKFVSIVTKCGIYDFFKRRQIPELTSIFCKWDNLWANEINKYKCGIEFNRTTTIADNDNTCRFEFDFLKN
jgi:hypothetical protein